SKSPVVTQNILQYRIGSADVCQGGTSLGIHPIKGISAPINLIRRNPIHQPVIEPVIQARDNLVQIHDRKIVRNYLTRLIGILEQGSLQGIGTSRVIGNGINSQGSVLVVRSG